MTTSNVSAGGWLFIWQGAASITPKKKRTSMALARNLLQQLELPIATPVQLVKEVNNLPSVYAREDRIALTPFCTSLTTS